MEHNRRRLIVEIDDDNNGSITIGTEGGPFLPGEASLILEQAAIEAKRIELVNHYIALHEKMMADQRKKTDPANDIILARMNLS